MSKKLCPDKDLDLILIGYAIAQMRRLQTQLMRLKDERDAWEAVAGDTSLPIVPTNEERADMSELCSDLHEISSDCVELTDRLASISYVGVSRDRDRGAA